MYTCTISSHLDGEQIVYYNPYETQFIEQEQIAFGAISTNCIFIPKEGLTHRIELSEALLQKLSLSPNTPLHLICENHCVYLGPLLGILTTGFIDDCNLPLGTRTDFFQKLLQMQRETYTVAYLFGPQHIHWTEGIIDGLVYEENHWHTKPMNFPNIIYDRLPNRKVEAAQPIIRLKQKFQNAYGIPIFNPNFFSKKEIYQCLQAHTETVHLIPKTITNPTLGEIHHLLHTKKCIFFKPQNGSLGSGIVKCIYHPLSQMYYANYYQNQQKMMRSFDRLTTLLEETVPNLTDEDYLIQEGVALLKEQGQPFDFRVHTNRDRSGNWKVSAIAVKVATKGAPTTHVKYGGRITVLESLSFPPEKLQNWQQKLIQNASQISQIIAEQINKQIGEIGFDFGIDSQEKLWLFEANAKPGRSIFSHPTLASLEQKNLSYIFQFACYLMKETITHPMNICEIQTHT